MAQDLSHPVQDAAAAEPPIVLREAARTPWGSSDGVPGREIVAVLALVVLCDLVIYRGHGFAGYALLFVMSPLLLWIGARLRQGGGATWTVGMMLAILAAKMIWCGSWLLVGAGFALVVAFSMSLAGQCPFVIETIVFASQTVAAGYRRLLDYGRTVAIVGNVLPRIAWLSGLLPLAALVVFGMIFILANPDWLESFWTGAERLLKWVRHWLASIALGEFGIWVAVFWISAGLLRPLANGKSAGDSTRTAVGVVEAGSQAVNTPLYSAFRNTLLVVIVLFAVYLVFEFRRLWFREFPQGFHYSGFAHQGAAWLTFALALATLLLSLVFRGDVLRDLRLARLKRLAWLWSIENFVLAVAVYHRLWIYVGFNGMTRMRTVGIFGTTTVLAGFVLVLWKIARHRDFGWLVRRQLWVLAMAVYLFALTPVDTIVVSYNVRRILAGDPAPSVEISVHPISSEGVLLLRPLLHCSDPIIREGVRAMLAQRDDEVESQAQRRQVLGWTTVQLADHFVLQGLRGSRSGWTDYRDRDARARALRAFHEYAYQWY